MFGAIIGARDGTSGSESAKIPAQSRDPRCSTVFSCQRTSVSQCPFARAGLAPLHHVAQCPEPLAARLLADTSRWAGGRGFGARCIRTSRLTVTHLHEEEIRKQEEWLTRHVLST